MRKRLVLGNIVATLVAGVFTISLAELGVGAVGAAILGAVAFVTLGSLHAIRIVNGLLGRLSQVEEAVLRATYGEPDVRLGALEPPFDGIAYRLDSLFAMVEQASLPELAELADPAGESGESGH